MPPDDPTLTGRGWRAKDSRMAPPRTLLDDEHAPPSSSPASLRLHGLSILVVEDESDARELVESLLDRYGAEVVAVASVDEAIEWLATDAPDVIISDIGMPVRDGYELIVHVRQHGPDAQRGIPAIALTAFAQPSDRSRAAAAGFDLHLAKPVDPAVLVDAVSSLVRGSHVRDSAG